MAVKIRLRRMGAKKQPFYRVVVADSRSPRDGRFLDSIGTYNPRSQPAEIRIDREKALHWLENGAEPTDSARSLLSRAGVWQRFTTGVWPAEKEAEPVSVTATPRPGGVMAAGEADDSLVPPPDAFAADSPAGPAEDPRIAPQPATEPPRDESVAPE